MDGMAYLQHVLATSELAHPRSVSIRTTEREPAVDDQLRTEFGLLFDGLDVTVEPDDGVRHTGHPAGSLVVLAHRSTTPSRRVLSWAAAAARGPAIGVGFYCVDTRRMVLMPPRRVRRWILRQHVVLVATRWAARHYDVWSRLGATCKSSS